MIYSMTGFGKTAAEVSAVTDWSFEISSVNRKQLELRINLPREFSAFENDIRNFLKGRISRGMVNIKGVYSPADADAKNKLDINKDFLDKIVENRTSKKQLGFEIRKTYTNVLDGINSSSAYIVASNLADDYVKGKIDSIEIVTTRYKNMMTYKTESWQLLPAITNV